MFDGRQLLDMALEHGPKLWQVADADEEEHKVAQSPDVDRVCISAAPKFHSGQDALKRMLVGPGSAAFTNSAPLESLPCVGKMCLWPTRFWHTWHVRLPLLMLRTTRHTAVCHDLRLAAPTAARRFMLMRVHQAWKS